MIRKAFVMQVNPDQHAEYEARHNPIRLRWINCNACRNTNSFRIVPC